MVCGISTLLAYSSLFLVDLVLELAGWLWSTTVFFTLQPLFRVRGRPERTGELTHNVVVQAVHDLPHEVVLEKRLEFMLSHMYARKLHIYPKTDCHKEDQIISFAISTREWALYEVSAHCLEIFRTCIVRRITVQRS